MCRSNKINTLVNVSDYIRGIVTQKRRVIVDL